MIMIMNKFICFLIGHKKSEFRLVPESFIEGVIIKTKEGKAYFESIVTQDEEGFCPRCKKITWSARLDWMK